MRLTLRSVSLWAGLVMTAFLVAVVAPEAQVITQRPGVAPGAEDKLTKPAPPAPPPSYIIGPDDVLTISVWREPDASGEVIVRPDGKITLKIGNDIVASGLTTDELKEKVTTELKRFYDDPTVFVQVKTINSRRVCITGAVARQGCYPLTGPMTVLHLVSAAGGLQEFADKKNLMLISATLKDRNGKSLTYRINYDDLSQGKNVDKYNIELRPGDQVIVR